MTFSKTGLVALSLAGLLVSGCSSTRFSSMDSAQPAPLEAAPAGKVTANQLPPPAAPGTTDPSQFPTAPNTQVAALPPEAAAGPDLTASGMTGVWTASIGGESCKIAMGMTKYGQAFRAAPLKCPEQPVIKSWNVKGKQLILYDDTGTQVAALYSSGEKKFDGQASNGQPISLFLQ